MRSAKLPQNQSVAAMDNLPAEVEQLLTVSVNDKIEALESFTSTMPQVDIPPKESFVNGMYTREILIPAGTILTGRVWKHPYVDIMISGDITVATPDGLRRLTGYNQMRGMEGRKRAGYAHEDTLWVTVHRTDLELPQPDAMRDELTFFSMAEYHDHRDLMDFNRFLLEHGVTDEQAWEQMLEGDIHELDLDELGLQMIPSPKHGIGLFTIYPIEPETLICPARIAGDRTQAGRYTNHAAVPNTEMRWMGTGPDDEIGLVSTRFIEAGEELTCNYRHPGLTIMEVETQ